MKRRARTSSSRQSTGRHDQKPFSDASRLERHLARILSSLATLLLRHGYGYAPISRLTKIAFVEAAGASDKKGNSKTNIARIAALTGLTRIEVSRLVRNRVQAIQDDTNLNRATRVANGWLQDSQFRDQNNRPRELPFTYGRGGFGRLVKKYSGDIPVRAMFTEMKRLGMVRLSNTNKVTLIRNRPSLPKSTVDAIRAISPWVNVLAEPKDSPSESNLSSTTEQLKIYFDSFSQVLAATRELEQRRKSFTEGIEQLGTRSCMTGKHMLTVYVAVAAAHPKRMAIGRTKKSRKHDERL
jgi:hypothetical protein